MHSPFQPLPGSGPPPRGLFIDRWGTLLDLPPPGAGEEFTPELLYPGVVDALFHAGQSGWYLYLLGNEEDVAFGRKPLERWQTFEDDLLGYLRAHGVPIRRSYSCTDHPQGVRGHDRDSVFLLPNTGALYHAAQVDDVVLRESWVIGDSSLELVAGWRAGCRLAAVRTGLALEDGQFPVDPDLVAGDLCEALQDVVLGEQLPRR